MIYIDDTIAAISTPIGDAGIGIIRLSGRDAIRIASGVFRSPGTMKLEDQDSHRVVYGHVVDVDTGGFLDEVLVTVMKSPRSYTREDVVEIGCHNGSATLKTVLSAVLRAGARPAEPGEFTRRAFLNGRIDLAQAEAVRDLIKAKTDKAGLLAMGQLRGDLSRRIDTLAESLARLCAGTEAQIDFPEEDIPVTEADQTVAGLRGVREELELLAKGFDRGRLLREGVAAAIVGKPNVGKSSLLNALIMKDRAIVTSIPGTTRDVIEEYLDIDGLPVKIMDTAGIRESHDLVEKEGVMRSLGALAHADIVLAVFDGSREFDELDQYILAKVAQQKTILVVNKIDIVPSVLNIPGTDSAPDPLSGESPCRVVRISALTGQGLQDLKTAIYEGCMQSDAAGDSEGLLITNIRHKASLENAATSLRECEDAMRRGDPLEVSALFLREALANLGEITGAVTTEDILDRIFGTFCIGK